MRLFKICLFFSVSILSYMKVSGEEANPPAWPANVIVVEPGDTSLQQKIYTIFNENGGNGNHGQWSPDRYAILLKPGSHNLDIPVGFYTSVIGLGQSPEDTHVQDVYCQNGDHSVKVGALDNFWRSAENFTTTPTKDWPYVGKNKMLWAVSQASPLRRVHVNGDLDLFQVEAYPPKVPKDPAAAFASGGYLADCKVSGTVTPASQQQWCSRNADWGTWSGALWNIVFVGCPNPPPIPTPPVYNVTTVPSTPVIAEKPYIVFENGSYFLMVPEVEENKTGSTQDYTKGQKIPFDQVYVATEKDSAATINTKLANGIHLILTPGNYNLTDSIHITKPNTYVLGIGFPTLISMNGNSCITVDDVDGVRIGGVLLQAGTDAAKRPASGSNLVLLKWGSGSKVQKQGYFSLFDSCFGSSRDTKASGFLYDCFARVGGTNDSTKNQVYADVMVQINSSNVVCDNLWLWRADHDINTVNPNHGVMNGANPCQHGFQANGDDIIAYGLAAEHTLDNLTEWNGENGQVYFYQSEYPYDVKPEDFQGKVSYKVGEHVANHQAYGIGVYCFFRDYPVFMEQGISTPTGGEIHFTNALSVFLEGKGGIEHVINETGEAALKQGDVKYVPTFP